MKNKANIYNESGYEIKDASTNQDFNALSETFFLNIFIMPYMQNQSNMHKLNFFVDIKIFTVETFLSFKPLFFEIRAC